MKQDLVTKLLMQSQKLAYHRAGPSGLKTELDGATFLCSGRSLQKEAQSNAGARDEHLDWYYVENFSLYFKMRSAINHLLEKDRND